MREWRLGKGRSCLGVARDMLVGQSKDNKKRSRKSDFEGTRRCR